MNHKRILGWLGTLALTTGLFESAHADILPASYTNAEMQAGAPRLPNIIFIRCHGLGSGDLSCYGQTNFQTPNLDKLAADGVRFSHFTAGAADFSGALAALMTGQNGTFAPGAQTLSERLQSAGYHTGLIGEWALGDQPWTQGFNEFAGFINEDEGRNYYADYIWRFAPHSLYDPNTKTISDYSGKEMIFANSGGQKKKYLPEMLINAATTFVKNNRPDSANKHRPFFLLVDLPAPRSAVVGKDVYPVPSDAPYTDDPWPQAAKDRVSLITRIDGGIGKLQQQLTASAITNNYVIIFSSSAVPEKFADKNLNFLTPNGNAAPGTDPAAIPLPLIVYGPDQAMKGQISTAPCSNADLMPTIMEIARLQPGKEVTGKSILPVVRGE